MMTNTVRKFGVGVATAALVAGVAAPAVAFDASPSYNVAKLRLSGGDRVGTSIAFAKSEFTAKYPYGGNDRKNEHVAYLAGYDGQADAAAAGSLRGPIFFVKADGSSNKDVAAAIKSLGAEKVVALGGEAAVPADVLSKIAEAADEAKTDRLGGKDRYETSVKIAEQWSKNNTVFTPGKVVIANGDTLVDALTAGTLGWPILLTDRSGKLNDAELTYLNTVKPQDYIAVGGTQVVPEATIQTAQAAALTDASLSTDDSLPSLTAKKNKLVNEDIPAHEDEAKRVAGLVKTQDNNAEIATRTIANQANLLANALVAAGKATGKSWYETVADANGNTVATQRDALATLINSSYQLGNGSAVVFAGKSAVVAKYLKISDTAVTVNTAALAADFVDEAVSDANDAIDAYYKKGTALEAGSLAEKVYKLEQFAPVAAAGNQDGVSVYQIQGVLKHIKDLADATVASDYNTLQAINLKIAGVADAVNGKSYFRISGKDRYATAAAISIRMQNLAYSSTDAESAANTVYKIFLVNGEAFADATVAGTTDQPILLARPDFSIPDVTTQEIIRAAKATTRPVEVWAVGGTKVITDAELNQANATSNIARPVNQQQAPQTNTYSVKNVQIKKNDTAGVLRDIMQGTDVLAGSNITAANVTEIKIDGVDAAVRNDINVVIASGQLKVTTTNNAKEDDYTVTLKYKNNPIRFTVSVVPVSYSVNMATKHVAYTDLIGTASDKLKTGIIFNELEKPYTNASKVSAVSGTGNVALDGTALDGTTNDVVLAKNTIGTYKWANDTKVELNPTGSKVEASSTITVDKPEMGAALTSITDAALSVTVPVADGNINGFGRTDFAILKTDGTYVATASAKTPNADTSKTDFTISAIGTAGSYVVAVKDGSTWKFFPLTVTAS